MRQMQLSEEDEQLSSLVSVVEAGESVTILRGERPVAQIIPFPGMHKPMTPQRAAAIARLKATMDRGYDLGIEWNGREELYERGWDRDQNRD